MSEFRFSEPENIGVFVCDNVRLRGKPILLVSHDEAGDWQFLCGGRHNEGSNDDVEFVCLREVVDRDQSLNELAGLCLCGEAERTRPGDPWHVYDRMEDSVKENVEKHACHVMKVPADSEGVGFAYSIGLTRTYSQPELICFGLADGVMHWMINELRDRMARGEIFRDAQRVSGLIEGYDCVLRKVQPVRQREFFGYALWFYNGLAFDALQIVWPDKASRFPWDLGYALPAEAQPATW